jgi:hypothetical protein
MSAILAITMLFMMMITMYSRRCAGAEGRRDAAAARPEGDG